MRILTGTLLSALGCTIGLSAGLWYGQLALDQFEESVKLILVETTDDAYIIGRQAVAFDCLENGFALLPPRAEQTTPAILICDKSALQVIPEEDIDQVAPQLNARPEVLKQSI